MIDPTRPTRPRRTIVVYPGQKVMATDGKVHTVAYEDKGRVFGFRNGAAYRIIVCGDAFGGEHDQEAGLAA